MPLMLAAAVVAGWFAFWTAESPSPTAVELRSDTACVHGGVNVTTLFGAPHQRFPDGSLGARTTSPLFVAFRSTGPVSVWVEGYGAAVRLRIDGRVARALHVAGARCAELHAQLAGRHRVGLELGLGARIAGVSGGVIFDELPDPSARVVFLGDSYTLGVGGTTPPGYAFRAGWAKGWDVHIDAQAGTGFLNSAGKLTFAQRVPTMLRQQPYIVVVAGGINDFGNFPNAQIAAAAKRLFARLEASGTQVIALSPWMTPSLASPAYRDLVARIATAARETHVRYIDTSTWLTPSLMSHDGIHPNERGYRAIAAKLALRL
jgi:lysophospholipase L1-like esterase